MKTPRLKLVTGILALLVLAGVHTVQAQELLDSLSKDDSDIVSAIAPYPADMRAAILNVSQYPQVLVKLLRVQARTSQSFEDLITAYPREDQEKFYQAVRFPELVHTLTLLGPGREAEARALVKAYPESVQQPIVDLYTSHFEDLKSVDGIYETSQDTFQKVTEKYPDDARRDFQKVVDNPDVMMLLTDNIDLVVSLGESYRNDPKGVTNYLDSMNVAITRQDEQDLADYKTAISSDAKLQAEMKKAADEFAEQYDQQDTTATTSYVTNNNYYGTMPYSYWFGYPYWYSYAMWYPMPYYYYTGFYYGLNGGMVVVGLPSFLYANWFFGWGYMHYPRLYGYYRNYYNQHPMAGANMYRGFNMAAHNHFSNGGRGGGGYNGQMNGRSSGYYSNGRMSQNTSGRNSRSSYSRANGSRSTSSRSSGSRSSYSNSRSSGYNRSGFNHYNATSYHSMGWSSRSFGGGFSGGRSFGGGGGGFGGGGGGHGGH